MNRTTAMLIGDADIRMQSRDALQPLREVEILGELTAFEERHARFVDELAPEIVVLDLAATGLNPLRVFDRIDQMTTKPRVIAVAPNGIVNKNLAHELGAASVVATDEALRQAVRREALRIVPNPDYHRAA